MEKSEQEQFHELTFYTLSHPDPSFIHQHIVDAYAAQKADANIKSIAITFALVGLYLHLEKNYTGKQVQLAHMKLATNKKIWPVFNLPVSRGNIRVSDILNTKSGEERDKMIEKWCIEVWNAYADSHEKVENLLKQELSI